MADKPLVIGVVGPTAGGKTALSLALAKHQTIEIVCMDSMQVYQHMDIGTAKPGAAERALVPHHILDVRPPEAQYSVAEYRQEAAQAIAGILARGALPVLVGGTGLYLRALSLPLDLGGTKKDEAIRQRYQALLDKEGALALHGLLAARDSETASRLHPNDTRRVIRALEVYDITGQPFSRQVMPSEQDGPYRIRLFAPDWPRDRLYRAIDRRVDAMMAEGLLDEMKALLRRGLHEGHQSMQGLGYKELLPYLRGEAALDSCLALIKQRTRQYAKRQLTWFRADKRVQWLPGDSAAEAFLAKVKQEVESP